ncbi:MAG: glutamine-hydrolyzing GMP synthase [Candidatus Pelagibacter sp. TMED263]|nr:MAG: glutamine-hydrolyzing GMP synthase [Candidatus Pelagibacter sp. TMED263]|tara:strand:- start:251 stop:1813 length:1563 start_codon:yes stop_codon:yes gene_type:complete
MQIQKHKEKIIIIDFGSQVTKLIARRVRDLGIFSEIITIKDLKKIKDYNVIKGIILSGGPSTVTKKKFPNIPKEIFQKKIPILGICYGLQLITKLFGGSIKSSNVKREFGRANLYKKKKSLIIKNFFNIKKKSVWMSHQDAVTKIPKGFRLVASTTKSKFTIIENIQNKIFGIQFHPEVTHTDNGKKIFENFLFSICKIKKKWRINSEKNRLINEVKDIVKKDKVICALSGGVDSSVVALLVNKAIRKNLICVMVNTGLMRKNEFKYTYNIFKKKYKLNVKLINASKLYLKNLKNIENPEKKRKIIGKLFIRIFENEAKKIKGIKFLAQGTLYPDVIESRSATGSQSSKIKSHHNVGGLPKKMNLKLIEPLKEFFKDEVRILGKSLGLIKNIRNKHPFPGPGLAIRILGKITPQKIKILQDADNIYINELINHNLYNKIWQAYAALLPMKTVGVMGDSRTYEYTCLLRAVTSEDGMSADYFNFPKDFLDKISNKIINGVPGINRVVYDITSKPPSTIELE